MRAVPEAKHVREAPVTQMEGQDIASGGTSKGYWNARFRAHWGPHAVGALAYGRQYNAWLYRVRKQVFRRIRRSLQMDLRQAWVLDVGCGTGFYIKEWLSLGVAVVEGLDISDEATMRLRRALPDVAVHTADIGDPAAVIPRNARFDVVSAFDVLFHIVDDVRYQTALESISQALRPGGYFLHSDNFLHGPTREFGDYWKSRSLSDVESALTKVGFEIVRRVPMFAIMNAPVDSRLRHAERLWEAAMKPVRRSELAGYAIGALLYPLEIGLLALLREGPSTEIMICRKT